MAIARTVLLTFMIFCSLQGLAKENYVLWDDLVAKMVREGESIQTNFGEYLYLAEVNPPDRSKERIASYISAVVYREGTDIFVDRVEAVWEDWSFDSQNNFRVNQWLFSLTPEGQLVSQSHSILILTPSGTHLGSEYPTTSPEEYKNKWQAVLQSWYQKL